MSTSSRLAFLLGLGALAALLVLSLTAPDGSPSVPEVVGLTRRPEATGNPSAPSVPQTDSLRRSQASTTARDESVESREADRADVVARAAAPRPVTATTVGAPIDTAAAASRGGAGRGSEAPGTPEDFAERPIGWCFRTWTGTGPWLAVSPPDEPIRGLRTEWRIVANGAYSAWLGTEAPPDRGFSADVMWQTIDATPYRGSRIELSAQLRGDASLVHLFFRPLRAGDTDFGLSGAQDPQNTLFSGGGLDRWARFSVVGDVATSADILVLGVAVYNRGHAWIDDVRLTKLDARAALTTPPTNNPMGAQSGERFALPLANVTPFAAPTNLDFEQTEFDAPGC